MSNENNKVLEYQKEVMVNSLINDINNSTNVFKELLNDNTPNNQMPEYVFQCIFAPYFATLRDPKADKSKINPELKGRWIGIAGSQYKGIDLVDNKGKVVDTTPGFYCQPDKIEDMDDVNFEKISATYERKKNRLAAEGEHYISEELNSISEPMVSINKKAAFSAEWDRILDKYLVREKQEEMNTISKESVKNISDDVKNKLNINNDELDYD